METLIFEFAKANPDKARQIFDSYIATITDPDRIANLELVREMACNSEFRNEVTEYVASVLN